MAKRVKVEVTDKHIKKGKCGDAHRCAIAQALFEQYGGGRKVKQVTVTDYGRVNLKNGDSYYLTFPKKAIKFIDKFDESKKNVKPITFTATVEEDV